MPKPKENGMNTQEIANIFEASLSEKLSSESIKKHIEDCTDKLVKSSIEKCFRTYGSLGKKIEEVLEEQFKTGLHFQGVDNYKNIIESEITKALKALNDNDLREKAEHLVREMTSKTPKQVTPEDIAKKYCDENYLTDEKIEFELVSGKYGDHFKLGDYKLHLFGSGRLFSVSGGSMSRPFSEMNRFEKFMYCLMQNESEVVGDLDDEIFMFNEDGELVDEY